MVHCSQPHIQRKRVRRRRTRTLVQPFATRGRRRLGALGRRRCWWGSSPGHRVGLQAPGALSPSASVTLGGSCTRRTGRFVYAQCFRTSAVRPLCQHAGAATWDRRRRRKGGGGAPLGALSPRRREPGPDAWSGRSRHATATGLLGRNAGGFPRVAVSALWGFAMIARRALFMRRVLPISRCYWPQTKATRIIQTL